MVDTPCRTVSPKRSFAMCSVWAQPLRIHENQNRKQSERILQGSFTISIRADIPFLWWRFFKSTRGHDNQCRTKQNTYERYVPTEAHIFRGPHVRGARRQLRHDLLLYRRRLRRTVVRLEHPLTNGRQRHLGGGFPREAEDAGADAAKANGANLVLHKIRKTQYD